MKQRKAPSSTNRAARRLLSEKRSLLKQIERYLAQDDALTGTSIEGLRQVESILSQDIEEIETSISPPARA